MGKYIVIDTDGLKNILTDAHKYGAFIVYDGDDNTDGESVWHCDVYFAEDEGALEDGADDAVWSFNSVENYLQERAIKKQGEVQDALLSLTKASLSSSSSSASASSEQPAHLQERLELTADMFDDFYRNAQELVDDLKGDENEQD